MSYIIKNHILGLVATIETEENEASSLMKSDFFMYDFNLNQWKLISNDTSLEFGPSAISSGQICLDQIRKMLYVFGGRSESASSTPTIYCYKILSDQWTTLDLKEFNSEKAYKDFTSIYENECYGHCMVFNPLNKQLVIYGGIVKGNLISDCFIISTTSLEIKRISFSNNPGPNLPEIAFHKGCYNPKTNSFFFYSGYMKGPKGVYQMNYLFECDIRKNRFRSVYKDFNLDRHYWSQLKQIVPMPRFSHQFLYHSKRDLFYLYGGNPNQPFSVLKERLNDLWSLKVSSPLNETILEETGLWIRKLKVYGMVLKGDLIGVKKELEGLEIKGIWKELLLWGVDEVEKEKLEVFKKIKAMCHCEKIKKRKFCVSYLDY